MVVAVVMDCDSVFNRCCGCIGLSSCHLGESCSYFTMYLSGCCSCAGLSPCILVLDCHGVLSGCCGGFSSCQLGESCNSFTIYLT